MCGIVGYVGKKRVVPVIIEGLRKLEYRGYDSAGIAVAGNGDGLQIRRAEGKLRNLEEVLRTKPVDGTYGIGHTRWATHGRPSEENAHPHRDCTGRIVVVHNGIVENYLSLKKKLAQEGHTFTTETDTEIIAHLVEKYLHPEKGNGSKIPLEEAVRKTCRDLAGVFALSVISADDPDKIVAAQKYYYFGFAPHWFVLTPWGFTAFLLFFVSGLVESNRTPFDVPEGESEIVAGHMTEYSGFKYATFFLAEYLGMFAVSGLAVTLFLGGWHAPFPFLAFIPSYVWFFVKLSILLFVFIWVRGTLPRIRVDQMMNLAWKFMLPMAFTCVVSAAVWHYAGHRLMAWLWSLAVIVAVYFALSLLLESRKKFAPRTYRFAE